MGKFNNYFYILVQLPSDASCLLYSSVGQDEKLVTWSNQCRSTRCQMKLKPDLSKLNASSKARTARVESLNIKSINHLQAFPPRILSGEINKNPVVWHTHCILRFNDAFQNLSKLLMEREKSGF